MKRKNLMFFMTDHQRADSIGMIQCGREVMPQYNKIAKEAVYFKRAYNTCPLCVPARTALATGKYPTSNGVVYNDWDGETSGEYETIHMALKKAGYNVAHIGVDHIRVKPLLEDLGLDFYVNQEDYSEFCNENNIDYKRKSYELRRIKEEVSDDYIEKIYSNHKTTVWGNLETFKDIYFRDKTLQFIESIKHDDRPFALFVYLWAPHPPLRVPMPYADMYNPKFIVLPENINKISENEPLLRRRGVPAQLAESIDVDEWKKVWSAHLGLLSLVDDILMSIITAIKNIGKLEETCIVLTADHGDNLGQHKMYQKMEMYEEDIKVPLIIKAPGYSSRIVDSPVSHIDIKKTLLELLGIAGDKTDGISLISIMKGEKVRDNRMVYSQYSGNPYYGTIRRAAVNKRYKYIYDSQYEDELYDLLLDPYEMRNVANVGEYKSVTDYMYNKCREYNIEHNDFFKWREER